MSKPTEIQEIINKLESLLERMERAKKTSSSSLLKCPKNEVQNIVWIDSRIEFWIETLKGIIGDKTRDLSEKGNCLFYQQDQCVYRNLMTKAIEDCEFMNEDKSCNAKKSDLINYVDYMEIMRLE